MKTKSQSDKTPEEEAAAQKAALEKASGGNGKTPTPAKPTPKTKNETGGKKVRVPVNRAHKRPTSASATQSGRDAR